NTDVIPSQCHVSYSRTYQHPHTHTHQHINTFSALRQAQGPPSTSSGIIDPSTPCGDERKEAQLQHFNIHLNTSLVQLLMQFPQRFLRHLNHLPVVGHQSVDFNFNISCLRVYCC